MIGLESRSPQNMVAGDAEIAGAEITDLGCYFGYLTPIWSPIGFQVSSYHLVVTKLDD